MDNGMERHCVFCLQYHDGRIRVCRHRVERLLNCCIMHPQTGPAPGIMVWGDIGFQYRTPLVHIAGTLKSQRYISEVLEPVVLAYIQRFPSTIFQQDNMRSHVTRNIQDCFFTHQIELLPWPACSPALSPIENVSGIHHPLIHRINFGNMWKPHGLLYPQGYMQSFFDSSRRVAPVIANNDCNNNY
ncbi:transposable element Tcb1 transposase [Trichonephila clavipes]|nr:transposable element Tcb1 transposase [Trichonephila clavipes]